MSQRALSEILELVGSDDEEGRPPSRATIKRKRQTELRGETPYGPLWRSMSDLVMSEGAPLTLSYLDPAAMFWWACAQCRGFQEHMAQCAAKHTSNPDHPWDLCIYCDEVSPGNQLKPQNDRKLQVVYFSLKQLGGLALSKEDSWFIFTAVRSVDAKRLANGMAQLMKRVLEVILVERCDVLRHGILLPLPNNQAWTLCCKLRRPVTFGNSHAFVC